MGRDRYEQIITRLLDVFWCAQHVTGRVLVCTTCNEHAEDEETGSD